MKTLLRTLITLGVLAGSSVSFGQTLTKGIEFEPKPAVPCHANTSCMWLLPNGQVQFFDGTTTTPKTVPTIVTSAKGDMALFNGTKWEKLASDNVNGHVLTVDTTTATGWKPAAAAGGGVTSITCGAGLSCAPNPITTTGTIAMTNPSPTLSSVYNNGTAPADSKMTLNSTAGGVVIQDNAVPLGGSLFAVANSTGDYWFIDVNPTVNAVQFGYDGFNYSASISGSELFMNAPIHFSLDNAFDVGSFSQTAANVFTRIVSSGLNTLALIGNGDQINLSATGFDPNVDAGPTLGTILKRFLSFAAKSGTIYYNNMGSTSTFGRSILFRGSALTASYPGSGQVEYSPMAEFQESFGQTSDPESGYGTSRWAIQARVTPGTSSPINDRLAFLSDAASPGTYSSTEPVFFKLDGVHAQDFVSTSSAPTLTAGASGLLGTLSAVSVSGTNDTGIVSFTTGTVGTASVAGNTTALAEILKITFSSGFLPPTNCTVEWFPMGTDSDAGGQNSAMVFNNAVNNNTRWGVCRPFTQTCSLYWNAPAGSGGWTNTTAYKLGYKISCF